MELRKLVYEFVVATLPLVVVYYIGWAYLYFYLNLFGINISELHFDNATIFIYAFAPVSLALQGRWWLGLPIIAAIAILLVGIRILFQRQWLLARTKLGNLSTTLQILLLVISLLCLLILLRPWLEWAAQQKKAQIWAGSGEPVIALITGEGKAASPSAATSGATASGAVPPQGTLSVWRDSYNECGAQEALSLIFSDEKAFYLLCKSTDDPSQGTVFEVRREFGLTSVRVASSGGRQ
jgi:hypothetical protein